jgi:trehalose 6-phosphate synthase
VESTANAIMKAIESPENDRRERMTSMWDEVRAHDVHTWARRFLKTLADVK